MNEVCMDADQGANEPDVTCRDLIAQARMTEF